MKDNVGYHNVKLIRSIKAKQYLSLNSLTALRHVKLLFESAIELSLKMKKSNKFLRIYFVIKMSFCILCAVFHINVYKKRMTWLFINK